MASGNFTTRPDSRTLEKKPG